MKTITLASTLLFATDLGAWAQGVHLLPGQTLSIEFNGVGNCRSTEPSYAGGTVAVVFGNDLLGPGEQLSLEIFEDNLNAPSVASRIYSPAVPVFNAVLESPGSWLDLQGVIRLSMLSGSLDVSYAHFWVKPDAFTSCETFVLVPEPRVGVLVALGGIVAAAAFGYRQGRRREAHECTH